MKTDVCRTLLIEDNPADAVFLTEIIGPSYMVDTATSLSEGRKYISNSQYDLIFLDLNLPDSKGLDGVVSIHRQAPEIPIIVMTGLNDDEIANQALNKGAQDFLIKGEPNTDQLHRSIRYAIERNRLTFSLQKALDERKKSRMEWKNTFNAIDDAIILLDLDKRIIRINNSVIKLFNKHPKEIIGRPYSELFEMFNGQCNECPLEKTIDDKKRHTVEITSPHTQKTYRVTTFPLMDEDGSLAGIVHITKDVTEHKALGHQLMQAQKMESIGTLTSGIAHDFNNLLAVILGFTSLAMDNTSNNPDLQEDLAEVYQAGQRATELVQQIMTFSRRSEGDRKPLKIRLIINEALKLLRSIMPTSIDFNIDLAKGLMPVMADPAQIHQIIMNLCTNAGQAMETKGGTLEVTLKQVEISQGEFIRFHQLTPGQYVELRVSDTGCGIAPEHLDSIFDPYFSTKDLGEGTGLGLSVVHGIVKQYGGTIRVESELGRGTCFTLYFPALHKQASEPQQESETSLPKGSGHILVVDDEQPIATIIDRILKAQGYETTTRNSSIDALAIFKRAPDNFDLVITDFTMPKKTGDQLAEEITALRPEIPIILMTGFSKRVIEKNKLPDGISALLTKPVAEKELLKTVSSLLNKQKSSTFKKKTDDKIDSKPLIRGIQDAER